MCPYEVARLSLARSRISVTTYHYLLDKNSRQVLIPGDKPLDKIVAVVDEAHNIRDFVSGNSTTTLSFSDIRRLHQSDARASTCRASASAISEINDKAEKVLLQETTDGRSTSKLFVSAITAAHAKDWLSDLVFELSTNSGVAWYSVATNRNLPSSIINLGGFLSALLSSLDSAEISLVKSDHALFLTDTRLQRGS